MRRSYALASACLLLAVAAPAWGQETDGTAEPPAPGTQPAQPRVNPPAIITPADPEYPPKALAERVHAVVVLEITISEQGQVTSAAVDSLTVISEDGTPRPGDGRYGFGPAAVKAAKRMVLKPAELDGTPFAVQISFTFRFALPPKPEQPEPDAAPEPLKPPQVNYRGSLIERGTRSAVAGATITVYRGSGEQLEGFEATSGADGSFEFYDLPAGRWDVRIEREGYIPVKTDEKLSDTELVDARYWIEKGSYSEYDLTVEADRPRKEVNRRSLSIEAISKVPGAISDDPVLVVENLPGVGRAGPGGGEIIVRGSGPEDTGVFINGIGVPLIYHFGGLKSVVPSKVVGGINFYPGNYSVAYGRAMGGVFDLDLKRVEPDIVHGSVDVSILDTSLYLEVPLGDNAAIAFAGRRSYVDFVLAATIPDDIGLALTSAPRYYDYQVLGNWRPASSHELRWLALGSDDLFELLFDDPANPAIDAESNDLSAHTAFQRIIADYRYTPSAQVSNLLRMSVGRDMLGFSLLGAFSFDATVFSMQLRDNLIWKISDRLTLETGIDSGLARFTGTIKLPPLQSEGQPQGNIDTDDVLERTIDGEFFVDVAPFVEAQVNLGRFTMVPGLRLDYFGVNNDVSADPRISARYQLQKRLTAKGGAAVVHQAPDFPEVDEVFGNPEVGLQRVFQYSAGLEWQPFEHIKGDVTLFYKDLDNLVSPTDATVERDGRTVALRFDNNGTGRVYGAELFVEHEFYRGFRGWVSYTLSRAERTDSGQSESRLFDFDQTHILAVVASYTLPRNWEVGARWRVVTGKPDTPIIGGAFDSSADRYDPIYGEVNSSRLPTFTQVDLRVDKTWVYDTWKMSAYLSLVNATNHENVEGITYNYDYTQQGSINGLPVLPIFGMQGEW